MPSCVLDCRVAVHVGQLPQAEPIVVLVARVGEPVNDHRVVVGVVHLKISVKCQIFKIRRTMIYLSNSAIEFIVGNG